MEKLLGSVLAFLAILFSPVLFGAYITMRIVSDVAHKDER